MSYLNISEEEYDQAVKAVSQYYEPYLKSSKETPT